MTHFVKKKCSLCHLYYNKLVAGNTCQRCYRKGKLIMPQEGYLQSLSDAEKKVREVKTQGSSANGLPRCLIYVPPCYYGKKVKVIVVEDKEAK